MLLLLFIFFVLLVCVHHFFVLPPILFADDLESADHKSLSNALQEFEELKKVVEDRRYEHLGQQIDQVREAQQQQQQQFLQQQTQLTAVESAQGRLALEMQTLKDTVGGEISTLKDHKIESVAVAVDAEKVKAAAVAEFQTAELAFRNAQIAKLNVDEAQKKRIDLAREAYAAQVESTQLSILAAKQSVLKFNEQWNRTIHTETKEGETKQEGKDSAVGLHFGIPASWTIDE